MASAKVLDSRWVRRYRIFFVAGTIILGIQVFLAYKFFPGDNDVSEKLQDQRGVSGKGRVNIEVLHEDPNGAVSSRRFKENYLVVDDEDSPSNSNPVNGLYNKHKVPPDKYDVADSRNPAVAAEKVPQHSHSRNRVIQWGNRSSLRLEELDFVPVCDITTKEAISAVHRAKTQRCKQQLVNITCLIQQGQLYPERLSSSCPSQGFTAGKSLGCYRDEKTFRLLSGYYANFKTTNSPQYCINMCLQSGFPYAGVQYSTECFCGYEEPPSTSRLPDSSCNMKCPSDAHEACGGYYTINVYETGIAKFMPQVPNIKPESGTQPVRIAYLLTLNGRALRQVRRLFKVLFHRDHFFFIHVDARQDYLYRELLTLEHNFPNVKISRTRFATIWGGASLLQMLLTSMKELLDSDWKWDFVINLSESDFPVKTDRELVEFLTANKGRNFVKSHGREVQRFIQKQGLDKTFVECDAHMWRTGDRRLPWGIQVDGGSDWVALSRQFVAYVASNASTEDPLLSGLAVVFHHTLLPAETFFHTVLRNSRFCNTYVDNNLHVTNWKRRLGCKCQYKHVVDWCGCSPNDFRIDDWPRLQGTEGRQLFFARKFEAIVNQGIINQLDEWLYGPHTASITGLNSYWQNTYHSDDLSPSPDDALVTLAFSLARLTAKDININNDGCSLSVKKIVSVTSYHFKDIYKGSLILFEAQLEEANRIATVRLETWIKPQDHIRNFDHGTLQSVIKSAVVSSDYDQKEQLLRNHLRSLGPFSEPALAVEIEPALGTNSAVSLNLTALWIDPAGRLAQVADIHVDDTTLTGSVKPTLRDPLLPGAWKVKLLHKDSPLVQTEFVVMPLEFVSGVPVSQQQAGFIHNGPPQIFSVDEGSEWDKHLILSSEERASLQRRSVTNARRFGLDLREWIDSLTTKFYKILDKCVDTMQRRPDALLCGNLQIEPCAATFWSSLSPDPKSSITTIEPATGRLHR
ncbi:xylosyltransferase oxt [Schistocerca americana]|uniref:xylosyltransferase oxt n=1 Tax=Schistocerca americana TaxID=7009 RepID=UPI001F4F5451|nr:xylosyltransferase oxt [Schistocerca americana]XP_049956348.1 xylosyltransferase oxt [Schistocerca serialis cubense]